MDAQAKLSIVVGTYNRLSQLRDCIESVARETRIPYRLYVTDAGSTDGSVEYLENLDDPRVIPVLVGKKLGQARAYNEVFEQVTTPYVCWISDDNVIVNSGLDTAVAALDGDPRIGMYALKVQDKEGPFVDAPYIGGFSTLGILNVNQGVLPTKVLLDVGGFGEAFRDYGIDPDLTAKVLLSGHDVVYGREIAIHHYRNWSVDTNAPEYHELRAKQARGIRLYEAKYARHLPSSPFFAWKKQTWQRLRSALGSRLAPNGRRPFLGQLPRDWNNIWSGRFIRLLDPILTLGKPYHLRQRIPASIRRGELPADPDPALVEAHDPNSGPQAPGVGASPR